MSTWTNDSATPETSCLTFARSMRARYHQLLATADICDGKDGHYRTRSRQPSSVVDEAVARVAAGERVAKVAEELGVCAQAIYQRRSKAKAATA